MGIETEGFPESDYYMEDVVQVALFAGINNGQSWLNEGLFNGHAALLPTEKSGIIR